ncbi:MAG: GspE/PulE family protein, partial [Clostridium sp.]
MLKVKKRLGDILVQSGKITQVELINCLKKQAISGKRLGELLIEDNLVTEEDVLVVLEIQLGIKRINLEFISLEEDALKKVPEALAKKHNLIPVSINNSTIKVAMSDPFNILALDDIRIVTGLRVEKVLESKKAIINAINNNYTKQYAEKVANEMVSQEKDSIKEMEKMAKEAMQNDITNDAPVIKLVDTIIQNAIRLKASDIHIEPFEKIVRVRNRIDGELQKALEIPKQSQSTLLTRIKILANLNIAEKRIPQDGRILTSIDGMAVDLRVSVLPTINGEKIVIRILSKTAEVITMESLGMVDDDKDKLKGIMEKPFGIILVTGPTGSGKSTTLYAVLTALNTIKTNIITVEDPVEYAIEGINQVAVNVKAGLTFASGLRSILRQDPDVIMVGEIRDGETAEIAIRASITGHIVLSTLHTNDAPSTVARLVDMGIEPYLVATSVNGIVAQRLVRKVCGRCSEPYEATDYEKNILGIDLHETLMINKGQGCPVCNFTGYKGRIGIYE